MAPNHWDVCPHVENFLAFAMKNGIEVKPEPKKKPFYDWSKIFGLGRKKRDVDNETSLEIEASSTAQPMVAPVTATKEPEKRKLLVVVTFRLACEDYKKPILRWMRENHDRWSEFLDKVSTLSL